MISSVGSAGSGLLASAMKNATTSQDVEVAVLKKNQDVDKANGEAALKLIASASASSGRIDMHV